MGGSDDPFSQVLRPPAYETEGEKHARLEREMEAKRVSDLIDEEIRRDRERLRRSKEDVKVLFASLCSHII
jgi:guanine nucleotide-binding protein subunit alpha